MHWAVSRGQVEIVETLLSHKKVTDKNHRDNQGITPLQLAAKLGETKIVEKLSSDEHIEADAMQLQKEETMLQLDKFKKKSNEVFSK